jgi:E1-E2 ATPase
VIFLVLFVFLVNALLKRDLLESFLFSVALAVGLTPELLPMIVSVTLASGAVGMARKGVIVKQLAAWSTCRRAPKWRANAAALSPASRDASEKSVANRTCERRLSHDSLLMAYMGYRR